MSKTLYIILIGFIAGLVGSYFYDQLKLTIKEDNNPQTLIMINEEGNKNNQKTEAISLFDSDKSTHSSENEIIEKSSIPGSEDFIRASKRSRNSVVI